MTEEIYKKTSETETLFFEYLESYVKTDLISWYQSHAKIPRNLYKVFSTIGLVAAILTPIIIPFNNFAGVVTGVTSAIASTLLGFFRWGTVWQGYKVSQFALESLEWDYRRKAACIDDKNLNGDEKVTDFQNLLNDLMRNVEKIHEGEVRGYFSIVKEGEQKQVTKKQPKTTQPNDG